MYATPRMLKLLLFCLWASWIVVPFHRSIPIVLKIGLFVNCERGPELCTECPNTELITVVWLPGSDHVDDEMGASRGQEKHPCFYNASGSF